MFVELDKEGNSNTTEHLDLLKNFEEVLGFDRMNSLIDDREFVGNRWFKTLNKHQNPLNLALQTIRAAFEGIQIVIF